jgi:hypothetical protein
MRGLRPSVRPASGVVATVKLQQGFAAIVIVLTAAGLLEAWPTLPSYLVSRRQLPEYITGERNPNARPAGQEQAGYFYKPFEDTDRVWRVKLMPYKPMPGDLLLFDDHNKTITFLYQIVGTGAPLHSAMIIERPDHTPAILEAGPDFITRIYILEPLRRMRAYPGTIMIRRPRQPLTSQQSEALTRFALAQEGKDYALARLMLQGTPLRCRSGLRKTCFAHTCMDRNRWTCSELTAAAGVAAGLLDRRRFPANAMYPRDFCYDERYDLSSSYGEPLLWTERPIPATLVPDKRGNLKLVFQETDQSHPEK